VGARRVTGGLTLNGWCQLWQAGPYFRACPGRLGLADSGRGVGGVARSGGGVTGGSRQDVKPRVRMRVASEAPKILKSAWSLNYVRSKILEIVGDKVVFSFPIFIGKIEKPEFRIIVGTVGDALRPNIKEKRPKR